MFFVFDRNLFQVFQVFGVFEFLVVSGVGCLGVSGVCWGVAVFGSTLGGSLSLSPR